MAPRKITTCSVEACPDGPRTGIRKGLCARHYSQSRRGLWPDAVSSQALPGSGYVNPQGYRIIYKPDHPNARLGRIEEHRFIMSEVLGRALLPGENVHHINGNRTDNKPSNLELWVTHQPKGQRPEDLVNWAHEILDRYEPRT